MSKPIPRVEANLNMKRVSANIKRVNELLELVASRVDKIAGKADCEVSANDYWYLVKTRKRLSEIE